MDPGMEPGMAAAPAPAEASEMMMVDPTEPPIMTAYYYRAGRRHNQTPRAPLCSDHTPFHNTRANVLFSDGAVKSISEGPWRELGFETPEEISARRREEEGMAPVPRGFY